ncbi:MAG: phosphodiester glycosidase family protein, partial [Aristaeellaceae bacterium]
MKTSAIRWIVIAVMLCAMALLISSPALAETEPLPLDQTVPGYPALESGWTYTPAAEAAQGQKVLRYASKTREWSLTDTDAPVSAYDWARYEDPTITVETTFMTVKPAYVTVQVPAAIVRIKVADPSQIRTAMSYDNYDKKDYVKAADMAKHVNAIAAVNGDFFKYHYNVGYVVRQGEFYRDMLNGKRDLLIIDQNGDFHTVLAATSEDAAACLDEMAQQGLTPINTFTLGPVLVTDGVAVNVKETITAKVGEFQYRYPQQRVAICQLGPLDYAIVEIYGKTDSSAGTTLQEMADFIAYLFPECKVAYNLDGGGSTNVIVNGERIHQTPGARKISDILYFASAWT